MGNRRGTGVRAVCALLVTGAMAMAACSSDGASDAAAPAATDAAPATDAVVTDAPTSSAAPSTVAPTSQVPQTTVATSTSTTVADLPTRDGAQHLHFEVGPIDINPGQNNIDYTRPIPQPEVDGWIVKIKPDLRLADGSVPPVDVVHLHHGVWLNGSKPDATAGVPERIFAAGEEKTITALPAPYGYQYSTSDKWILNFMLHDLLPDPTQVWITYDIDFIPADAPEAAGMVPARPIWMDVQNGSVYPVFDVIRGEGTDGTFTYPDQADDPARSNPGRSAGSPARSNACTIAGATGRDRARRCACTKVARWSGNTSARRANHSRRSAGMSAIDTPLSIHGPIAVAMASNSLGPR